MRFRVINRVHLHSYIPDHELGALYARAGAFAFLSDYEGFGFTPLEALAAGVPIVVLDTTVAREIYGNAAIYVGRPDPLLIEAALEQAMFHDDTRARVLAAPGARSWLGTPGARARAVLCRRS